MECDALFADSDDEVEVLPTSSEIVSTDAEEPESKPVSSNYVNSTTPTQTYEVNLASVAPPVSSHTPVPEEYQPLPDSSSSLDYALSRNINSANGQRFPDVNIRYQPKPVSQRGYYYPNFSQYDHSVRPALEYVLGPYHSNNIIVLSDDRNYMPNPVAYSVPQTGDNNPTPMETDHSQPQPNNWSDDYLSHSAPSTFNRGRNNPSHMLERPSRKLNISPRRRQSKENEAITSLIEVSSEEEDSVSVPPNKPGDNSATHQASGSNSEIHANRASNNQNASSHRVIKREPQEHETGTQAAQTPTENTSTVEHDGVRRNTQRHYPGSVYENFYTNNTQVKQENSNCGCTNRLACRVHRRNSVHNNVANRFSPDYSHQNGPHHYHHHHHHHRHRQCSQHNVGAATSNTSLSHVKGEPGMPSVNVKQESDPPSTRSSQELALAPSGCAVKVEVSDQSQVKTEPSKSNAQSSGSSPSVIVKVEKNNERCCDVNAGGDRRVKEKSPQPGTSMGRTTQTESRASNNEVE